MDVVGLSAEQFNQVDFSDLPNGDYPGTWSAYEVEAKINGSVRVIQGKGDSHSSV